MTSSFRARVGWEAGVLYLAPPLDTGPLFEGPRLMTDPGNDPAESPLGTRAPLITQRLFRHLPRGYESFLVGPTNLRRCLAVHWGI